MRRSNLTKLCVLPLVALLATDTRVLWADERADSEAQAKTALLSPDDQTRKVVTAAEAVLATLNETERSATMFKFNDEEQRLRWSNLPTGIFERKGLRTGDMKPAQLNAVMMLLRATLSEDGYRQVEENIAAEETLNTGARRGRLAFGKDEFYFSILGTPSITEPWMWQFGGHHLAINATIVRDKITLGPSLTGGQPMVFTREGQQVIQMADEIALAFQLVNSLDEMQRSKAIVSAQFGDMILGPGRDDVRPEPEGLAGKDLTEAQLQILKKLVSERVALLNEEDAAVRMSAFEADFGQTHFSWRGPTTIGSAASYRVQGPGFFLEFAPQQMGGSPTQHIHAMYREFRNDYGEEWIKAE